MQITLKQKDIEAALKQYIASQGIRLYGKIVDIAFTAGRKETGISADLVIEDDPNALMPPLLQGVISGSPMIGQNTDQLARGIEAGTAITMLKVGDEVTQEAVVTEAKAEVPEAVDSPEATEAPATSATVVAPSSLFA